MGTRSPQKVPKNFESLKNCFFFTHPNIKIAKNINAPIHWTGFHVFFSKIHDPHPLQKFHVLWLPSAIVLTHNIFYKMLLLWKFAICSILLVSSVLHNGHETLIFPFHSRSLCKIWKRISCIIALRCRHTLQFWWTIHIFNWLI